VTGKTVSSSGAKPIPVPVRSAQHPMGLYPGFK